MDDLISIYIGFSRPKNRVPVIGYMFSWLIRLVERTKYSHVYVRWYSRGAKVDVVYEASGTQVHFSSKEKVFDEYAEPVKEYEIKITREQYRKALNFCMTHAGVDYGTKGAMGIGWVYLGQVFGKKWKNPWADGDYSWFCNELIGQFLEVVKGVELDIDIESVGPKGFDTWLNQFDGAKLVMKQGRVIDG